MCDSRFLLENLFPDVYPGLCLLGAKVILVGALVVWRLGGGKYTREAGRFRVSVGLEVRVEGGDSR